MNLKDQPLLKAIRGTLYSIPGQPIIGSCTLTNNTDFPLQVYWVTSSCTWDYYDIVQPGSSYTTNDETSDGTIFICTNAYTGGFVTLVQVSSMLGLEYSIDYSWIFSANDIGPVPEPTKSIVIPRNTPRVLVAAGPGPNQTTILHEQYWSLLPDSYSLAPHEKRVISSTITAGKQKTSSTQENVTTSLSASAGGGWGSISASVSASFSANATAFQQVTINEESTAYTSDTVQNELPSGGVMMCLRWQLTDAVTIFDASGSPKSCIISGQSPVVIKVYDSAVLPDDFVPPAGRAVPSPVPAGTLIAGKGAALPKRSGTTAIKRKR